MSALTGPMLLAVGSPVSTGRARLALEPHGYQIVETEHEPSLDDLRRWTAMILSGPESLPACRRIGLRPLDERPLLLYLAPDNSAGARLAGFANGADAVLPPAAESDEVLAQVRVLDRWQSARNQWQSRAAEASRATQQLQSAFRQIELDLLLAGRLQASFLPRSLPVVGSARFGVCYRPCGQVGGDFYDVLRLDEHHVGFYVADAMGHGVPASLLTIFLKKAVQPKDVTGSSYRLVPPGEVLARLNRELVAQELADLPFITMLYGLLDCRSGHLEFARAAAPHPICVPREGLPVIWSTPGTLLGIFAADYPPLERELLPGDRLLVHTDGVPDAAPIARLAAEYGELPIQALVDRIARDVMPADTQADDFTLLGLEMQPE